MALTAFLALSLADYSDASCSEGVAPGCEGMLRCAFEFGVEPLGLRGCYCSTSCALRGCAMYVTRTSARCEVVVREAAG